MGFNLHGPVQLIARKWRVLAWQQEVYAEESLPGWLRDSLVNIFAVLRPG